MNSISPANWEELVSLKSVLPTCTPDFARLPEDLTYYRLYQELVSKEIRLEILIRMLSSDICLIKNMFPYTRLLVNLPRVKQYCLWSKKSKLSDEEVELKINQTFPSKPYFWFENSEATKSVPEIWHCHIFVKED